MTRTHETDTSVLDRTLAINVKGVWLGAKYAIQQFLNQEPHPLHGKVKYGATEDVHRGWIVNTASVAGSIGIAGASSYCTSKGAVLNMTRALALEYAKDGIHIVRHCSILGSLSLSIC
jgi:NAD(P)-dependent dehydrogenase (short-subunit alcohol dehydrogenase family)